MTSDFGKGPTPLGLPSDHSGAYLSSQFRRLMIASASRVQAREGQFLAPAKLAREPSVPLSAKGLVMRSEGGQPNMSVPEEDTEEKVVRLGTETLFAIAEQLRRMYDADLRTKPSEKLEQLMRRIERGEDVS